MDRIASIIFSNLDSVVFILGVVSITVNQGAQVWAWWTSPEPKIAKVDRLIEGAISCAYLLKGQSMKKANGKLTFEQGREVAGMALGILKGDAIKADIDLNQEIGDDAHKLARIQSVFGKMRSRMKREKEVDQNAPKVVA